MDFIEVCEVFGGSIFSDEYRGSYEEADRKIRALGDNTPATMDPVCQYARILLLRAIFHMLSGNFPKARECNQSLQDLQHRGLDERWKLRSKIYSFYGNMLQYRLPLIRFAMIPGDPYEGLKKDASYLKNMYRQAQQAGMAISSCGSAEVVDMLEQALVLDLWSFLDSFHFSFLAHPNFTPCVTTKSLPQDHLKGISFDNMQVPYLSTTLAESMSRMGPVFTNTLERWSIDIELARGSENGGSSLSQLGSEYEKVNDYAGLGLCKIIEGDCILSPSYTNPIAMNLICEIRESGWANVAWDALEETFSLHNDKAAQECYSQALFYMEAANAPRGQAAVYLRRACLNHAEGISSKAGADNEQFRQAESDLLAALSLFAHDDMNSQIVVCHQILLGCSRGASELAISKAKYLGGELHKTESSAMSHFLGVLMLRFAHSQFSRNGNVDVAATCCQCAIAYYAALDNHLGSLCAAEAYITLLKTTHDWALAEAKIRETIKPAGILHAAFAYIDGILTRDANHQHLQVPRASILLEFDTLVKSVCSMTGRETLRAGWEEVRQALQPRRPVSTMKFLPLSAEARAHLNDPQLGCGESEQEHFIRTYETRNSFITGYFTSIDHSFEAIGRGDIDAAEAQLQTFIHSCDSQNQLKEREILSHKIPALAQLSRVEEMRQELPRFLSDWFSTDSRADSRLLFNLRNMPSDVREHAMEVRANTAHEDIAMCFTAQAWDKGSVILRRISKTLPEFTTKIRTEPKPDSWQLLTFIGAIYEREGNFEKALDSFLGALHQLENLRYLIPNPDSRRRAYSSLHTAELFCGLTRTSLAMSLQNTKQSPREWRLPATTWRDQALIFMEQGRARSLLEILQAQKSSSTESIQEWMDQSYRARVLSTLVQSRCDPQDEADVTKRAAKVAKELGIPDNSFDPVEEALKGWHDTTAQVFKSTMFLPDTRGLLGSIPSGSAVIEVAICMSGIMVMCISSEGIQSVHQSSLGVYQLRRLVVAYLGKMQTLLKDPVGDKAAQLAASLSDISAILSAQLIKPFTATIRKSNAVIFVPTSYLNVFPLSALILDGEPLILKKPVYQIPSLNVLRHLSHTASNIPRATGASVLADCGTGRKQLHYVGPEVVSICNSLRVLPTEKRRFLSSLNSSEIIHISSHGSENYSSPWESTVLGDEFRVVDMAKIGTRASLVAFSCCLSGKGQISSGDDLVGFSHAVLQSGSLAFIGGLWKVDDATTMLLMHLFYKQLAAQRNDTKGGGTCLAVAWHRAVRELYRLDSRSAGTIHDELEEMWKATRGKTTRPEGDFTNLKYMMDLLRSKIDSGKLDFTLPCYWAPFSLVGYGNAVVLGPLGQK
ncbi:hypothetical protein CBS12448_9494 [Aspergillus niger]|nr:hypothetical protein CBS12448_9494 [Aspergillus niger]KAI2942553.1 hypothetical protein CBS147322_8815 [Aspergillus niger]